MFYIPENGGIETKMKLKSAKGAEIFQFFVCPNMGIFPNIPKNVHIWAYKKLEYLGPLADFNLIFVSIPPFSGT